MGTIHKIREIYGVEHTDNRGRNWQAKVTKNSEFMGIAPITWVDQSKYEKGKGLRKLRAWFKTKDLFDEYVKQPRTFAVLANAKETDIPESASRSVKDFVRVLEIKVEGEPQLHEIGAYYLDVEIVRFDP